MPPAKNYAFTLSHRRWECEPKSRQPESNLGCLQALQFSIGQISFKFLKGEKKEKKKK